VVSLSTADPPLLTALAVGHVTITAGGASADVTVSPGDPNFPGTLPLGTVLWSVPGNVNQIVPAVPSPSGVADVFAFQCANPPCNGSPSDWDPGAVTVQAITSDGATAWTANLNDAYPILPDFLGGLVFMDNDTGSISSVDGTTGQTNTLYTPPNQTFAENIAVHPDGTIFAVLQDYSYDPVLYSVIGVDPTTGAQKFSVPVPQGLASDVVGLMIAGDGYAYVPYDYSFCLGPCFGQVTHVALLRVDSSGDYDNIAILDQPGGLGGDSSGGVMVHMITNADQGILFTLQGAGLGYTGFVMAVTTGTSVSLTNAPVVFGSDGDMDAVQPVLQAQDGSFIGTVQIGWDNGPLNAMAAFDQSGNIRWTVPGNYQPQIATADGGLIATDPSGAAYTFDQYGNATGVLAGSPTQSWMNETYTSGGGGVSDVALPPVEPALGYESQAGGNASGNGTSIPYLGSVEARPVYGGLSNWKNVCNAPGTGVPQVQLTDPENSTYYNLRTQLLSSGSLASNSCSALPVPTPASKKRYSGPNPAWAAYFPSLAAAVGRQQPWNGSASSISLYTAGVFPASFAPYMNLSPYQEQLGLDKYQTLPVCSLFVPFHGKDPEHIPLAVAQSYSNGGTARDVYINSDLEFFNSWFSQGTILHESVHNLTGLADFASTADRSIFHIPSPYDLKTLIGIETKPGRNPNPDETEDITQHLVANGCATGN